MRTLRVALVVALLLPATRPALAQAAHPTPRVIAGLSVAFLRARDDGLVAVGPVLIVPASPASALQLSLEVTRRGYRSHQEIDSIYAIEYRHTFRAEVTRPHAFMTVGVVGFMTYSRTTASPYSATHFDVSLPIAPIVSMGIEGRATRRVGFQVDVGALVTPNAAACRFSAAASIALGHLK